MKRLRDRLEHRLGDRLRVENRLIKGLLTKVHAGFMMKVFNAPASRFRYSLVQKIRKL